MVGIGPTHAKTSGAWWMRLPEVSIEVNGRPLWSTTPVCVTSG